MSWTPVALNEVGVAGTVKNVSVSFTASEDLSNALVWVAPELQPYLQVAPTQLGNISKGQIVELTVTITTPASASPELVNGTIHLRNDKGSKPTIAKPLPVSLNLEWPTFQGSIGAVRLRYPATFVLEEHLPVAGFQSLSFSDPSTRQGFTVEISNMNPVTGSIEEWANQQEWPFADDWREHFVLTTISSMPALQDPTTGSAIVKSNQRIVDVKNGIGQDPVLINIAEFQEILGTLQFMQ